METRVCSVCGKEKELSFYRKVKLNGSNGGYAIRCKVCMYGHEPYKRFTRNTDELTEKECLTCKQTLPVSNFDMMSRHGRKYYLSSCKKCRNKISALKRGQTNFYRVRDLHKNYGITLEDFNDMIELQEGKCLICNTHLEALTKGLVVDHCHTTGKVRGLLCSNCNSGLGMFKDNVDKFRKGY